MDPKQEKSGIDVHQIVNDLESKQMNIQGYKLNMLQVIVLAATVVELISCFLPMFTMNFLGISQSVSYIKGDGIIAIALAIGTCACLYFHQNPVALGLSVANLGIIVYDSFLGGANSYGLIKLSIGGYLLILSALVILAGSVMTFVHHKK